MLSSNELFSLHSLLRAILFAVCAHGNTVCWGQTEFKGAVSVGIEHDSNVAVDEIDRSSSLSDIGRLFEIDLELLFDIGSQVSGRAFYSLSAVDYAEFKNLNRQTQYLGAAVNTNLNRMKAGLSYFYTDSQLNHSNFLKYHRVSPSLSGFTSKRWFFRGAYVFGDKEFETISGRDAKQHGLETDAYYFWRGLRRYFNMGYTYRLENSRADRFSYDSHQIKFRAVQRFDAHAGRYSSLELNTLYENRKYDGITPSIRERRADDRIRVVITFEYPLTASLNWEFYGDYSNYLSNLPSADYEQTIIGTAFRFSF